MSDLKTRFSFFALLTAVGVGAILASFMLSTDAIFQVTIVAVVGMLLALGFRLSMYSGITHNRVRITAITAMASVCVIAINAGHAAVLIKLYNIVLVPFVAHLGWPLPSLEAQEADPWIVALSLLAMVAVCGFTLAGMGSPTAMGRPERSINDVLPWALTNEFRLKNLKNALRDHLDITDRSTQWNDANYVPLHCRRIIRCASYIHCCGRRREGDHRIPTLPAAQGCPS